MDEVQFGDLHTADPDDPARRILATTKENLTAPPPSLAFRLGTEPGASSSEDFHRMIREELVKWREVARKSNLKFD